jgi:hypothetical protein
MFLVGMLGLSLHLREAALARGGPAADDIADPRRLRINRTLTLRRFNRFR